MLKIGKIEFLLSLFFLSPTINLLCAEHKESKEAVDKSSSSSTSATPAAGRAAGHTPAVAPGGSAPSVLRSRYNDLVNAIKQHSKPLQYVAGGVGSLTGLYGLSKLIGNSPTNNILAKDVWEKADIESIAKKSAVEIERILNVVSPQKKNEALRHQEILKKLDELYCRGIANPIAQPGSTQIPAPPIGDGAKINEIGSIQPKIVAAGILAGTSLLAWKIWSYNEKLEKRIKETLNIPKKYKYNLRAVDAPDREKVSVVKETFKISAWRLNKYNSKELNERTVLFPTAASIYSRKAEAINCFINDIKNGQGIEKVYIIDYTRKIVSSDQGPTVIHSSSQPYTMTDIIFRHAKNNIQKEYIELREYMQKSLPSYNELLGNFLNLCRLQNEKVTVASDFYLLTEDQAKQVFEQLRIKKNKNFKWLYDFIDQKFTYFVKLYLAEVTAFCELMNIYTRLTALERIIDECYLDKERFGIQDLKQQSGFAGTFRSNIDDSDLMKAIHERSKWGDDYPRRAI